MASAVCQRSKNSRENREGESIRGWGKPCHSLENEQVWVSGKACELQQPGASVMEEEWGGEKAQEPSTDLKCLISTCR